MGVVGGGGGVGGEAVAALEHAALTRQRGVQLDGAAAVVLQGAGRGASCFWSAHQLQGAGDNDRQVRPRVLKGG